MKAKLVKHTSGFILYDEDNITIGAEPNVLSSNIFSKLSLKNCQAIERGYDLDELAEEFTKDESYGELSGDLYKGYIFGFQKAVKLMGDKKFSEDDMIKAYIQGTNDGAGYEGMCDYDTGNCTEAEEFSKEAEEEFIQSLQQTEWDVTFNPKELDANGCLILKLKSE